MQKYERSSYVDTKKKYMNFTRQSFMNYLY